MYNIWLATVGKINRHIVCLVFVLETRVNQSNVTVNIYYIRFLFILFVFACIVLHV